jgi:hypothetical protein
MEVPVRGKSHPRWLLVVPYVWMVAAVPLINRVHLAPGGVPFLAIWMLAGILVTSASIGLTYTLEKRQGILNDENEGQPR